MITLKTLQSLSKENRKTRVSDKTIAGLVWNISDLGQVSASYRLRRTGQKVIDKVFRRNMLLRADVYNDVRKEALSYMLKAANGEQLFEEQVSEPKKQSYTIGEYYLLFRKDRPAELSVKHRRMKRPRSVARDNQVMRWLFGQVVKHNAANKPILFSDINIADSQIPSFLDWIIADTVRSGKGTGNMEKSLTIIKQMFKNARRNKIIDENPLEDFYWTPPPSKRAKDIPVEVIGLIIKECRKLADGEGVYRDNRWRRMGLMFEFKMLMGMRVAEAMPLEKDWIDFRDNSITMPAHKTKTDEEYRFTFPDDVCQLLRKSPAWDEPHNKLVFGIDNKLCNHYDKLWHVVLDQTGVCGSVAELISEKRRLYREGRDITEISARITEFKKTRYRGHDTRHAFATDQMRSAVQAGMVMSERDQHDVLSQIGKGLQHSDTKTTAHYVRPDDEIKRKMVENRQAALQIALSSAK